MLVDKEIRKLIEMKVIRVLPVLDLEEQLNPIGLDVTLDTKFKKILKSDNTSIDPIVPFVDARYYEYVELLLSKNSEAFVLHPGEFTLGQSFEYVYLPPFIGAGLDGKSSLGRLSLTVHTTAASIDPGFGGHITLELYNNGGLPIVLHPLEPVARLVFHLTSTCEKPYSGHYAGQTEVRSTKSYDTSFSSILYNRKEFIP
jgi:dCTP deaminase